MKVYAKCIDGAEEAAKRRIEAALNTTDAEDPPAETPTRMRHDE